jgi:DnaD/phage-associated family protein
MTCFGKQPTPILIQQIVQYIDEDGLDEELVCLAFKKAADNGAGYPYARSILNTWVDKGIKTLANVEREQKEFQARRQQTQRKSSPNQLHHEIVPEWMKNKPKEKTEPPKSNDPEWDEILKNMTPEESERYLNAYTAILNTDQSAEDFQREYKEKYKKTKLREKQEEQKRAEYLEKYLSEI